MTAKKEQNDGAASYGWVADESGYERTRCQEIIVPTLARLKKDGVFLTLYHKGYQSGSTVLINHGEQLEIDRPHNWEDGLQVLRVAFRDEAKLWNHFTVSVLSVSREAVYTTMPMELFQLQRRSNYRVGVPSGSRAVFHCKDKKMHALGFVNISAGGMLIRMEGPVLFQGDVITSLEIILPAKLEGAANEQGQEFCHLKIGSAQVVRSYNDRDSNHIWFGLKFQSVMAEEEELHRYIRQRELELLHKGVAP